MAAIPRTAVLVAALIVAHVRAADLSELDSAAMYVGRRGGRLQTVGSFVLSSFANRAGNDELEDAERHEDLGTSQLQEGAAAVELSEPLHKIVKTSRGGRVHCPDGKTCHLVCKGYNACSGLKGGTGHFAKITCDSGTKAYACMYAKLPDCAKDKTCELECKGHNACRALKGGTGHFAKITCDAGKTRRNAMRTCNSAKLPDCPEGKTCELECKGNSACYGLKSFTGHFARITCKNGACNSARMPNCPAKARCELVCTGSSACHGLKKAPVGATGSTVDLAGNYWMPAAVLPEPAALSPKMIAFRAVGVKGYDWPPEQCKAQAETQPQLTPCPGNQWHTTRRRGAGSTCYDF